MTPDMQMQAELEKLFHKNETMPRLRSEFRQPEIIDQCIDHNIPMAFAVELMSQMILHKRASVGILVGILHSRVGDGSAATANLQLCADLLLKAAEADLVDWDDISQQFIIKVDVTQDVYDDMDRYQYPLPMVVQPKEIQNNRDTGYLTSKGSVILKSGNHHDEDVCLDHLNRVNKVALTINSDTAQMVKNKWRNLDKQKSDETKEDFENRKAAFEKYDRNAKEVMEHLTAVSDRFWLTHKYDKRGRTYCQGYAVNPQGTAWSKAVVEFAEGELTV